MIIKFLKELETGEIHQRDQWQFELKSDFLPKLEKGISTFSQEFYLFVPNSLHINPDTYSLKDFYSSVTNFIRYKTPQFTFDTLLDLNNSRSPLYRMEHTTDPKILIFEGKLLGNVVRSTLRETIAGLILSNSSLLVEKSKKLSSDLENFRDRFNQVKNNILENDALYTHLHYIDEFINDAIIFYLTSFLEQLEMEGGEEINQTRGILQSTLVKEELYRKQELKLPLLPPSSEEEKEHVLYRNSLLNKYMLDSLLLSIRKESLQNRMNPLAGAISAGIAMLFFFVLFVWQGQVFVNTSMPFILITVLLYILKDRLKEYLRSFSFKVFHKWFFDWKTRIRSPDESIILGEMVESFSMSQDKNLSQEINQMRNRDFHDVLEQIRRPEWVLCYKKKISISKDFLSLGTRREGLNVIFRFNVRKFLEKGDDPRTPYVTFDPEKNVFIHTTLPKVYHINIILKNTLYGISGEKRVEWKKYRLVVDKERIKRVEYI